MQTLDTDQDGSSLGPAALSFTGRGIADGFGSP
jgi:hypothetical protein